ncbi:MAG: autotransporter domain-containing protein [Pseudomonadota bacterium]
MSDISANRVSLKISASAAAIAAALAAMPVGQAMAQSSCDIANPMTGDSVVCTFGSDPGTNDATPITAGINAPGSQNVDLTIIDPIFRGFNADAVFSGGTPTIALGGGSSILVRNASVSNLALLEEGTVALSDFGQVFQEPYTTLFNDFAGLFAGGAMPTAADAQQVLDDNNINFTIDPADPLGIETAFAAAFTDAGVSTSIELDDEGDPVLIFGDGAAENDPLNEVFGFPVQGEALTAINTVITDANGAVITLGASSTPVDNNVISQIRSAPGTGGALAAGQNGITLGQPGGDDGDIFAIGASGIELAAGSVTRFTSNGDGIGVIGNGGAGIILNAGVMDTSTLEVVLRGGAEIVVFGEDTAAIRVNGDNAILGLSSNFGGIATLGNNSPLIALTEGNSVFTAVLTESGAAPSEEFDFDASFVTFGDDAPLFKLAGDTATYSISADNIGTGTAGLGFVSTGDNSSIFDVEGGSVSINVISLVDSVAQTSGEGSSIVSATFGSTSSTTVAINGSDVTTFGANAAAFEFGPTQETAVSTVVINNNSTVRTEGDGSTGVRLSGVSAGSAATQTIENSSITTLGDMSDALRAQLGASGSSSAAFTLAGSTLQTSGNFAHGAVFTSAFGDDVDAMSNAAGAISTSSISTTGLFSNALVIGENVTIYGPGLAVPTDGAAKITVDTFDAFTATDTFEAELDLSPTSRGIQNNGTIEVAGSGIAYSAGVEGRIANAGTINGTGGTAVTFASDTNDIFELQPGGIAIGNVDGAGGTDTFILGGTGEATFDSDLLDTQYVNFEVFEKEDLSTWTLTSDDARAWNVHGGDLIVASGTNLTTDGANPVFTVTEGLSSTTFEGFEQIIKTRGQAIINDGAALNSSVVDVAAIVVEGNVITEDLPVVDSRPPVDNTLPFRDRFETEQTFSDVRIAGIVDTTANGAVGIQGRTVGDAAPVMTISLEGDGSIQTSGADSFGIAGGDAGSSNVRVFADENSAIRTSGARSAGIAANGGGNAVEIVLLDSASISTIGSEAAAIRMQATASIFNLISNGTNALATSGDGSSVILVNDFDSSAASTDLTLSAQRTEQTLLSEGQNADLVSVTSSAGGGSSFTFSAEGADSAYAGADFETLGDGSNLMRVNAGPSSSVTASIEGINAITRGVGAGGYQLATGDTGDLTFSLVDSSLATLGANSTALDLSVGENGTIIAAFANNEINTIADGSNAISIHMGSNGDLQFGGPNTIVTSGEDAVGLFIQGSVGGTNDVNVGGTITTIGAQAHAVWLDEQLEDLELTGILSTSGEGANGIGADGSLFGIVTTADSSITTTGIDADGIWIDYLEAPAMGGDLTDGSITVNGAITTSGDMADGIWVGYNANDNDGGNAFQTGSITLGGTITTSGEDAFGIGVIGEGAITLAEGSQILTSGEGSDGIWLDRRGLGSDVATLIDVDGNIRASGDDAHGITVFYGAGMPMNAGNAGTITISGNVEGGGSSAASDGVRLYLDNGAATTLTLEAGGDVFSGGDVNSRGIYLTALPGATGTATATINIDAGSNTAAEANVFSSQGTVIAEGNDGGAAIAINTTLDIAGQVVSGGSDRIAIDLGLGDDTIFVREGAEVRGGGIAMGAGNDIIQIAGDIDAGTTDALLTGSGDDEVIVLPTAMVTGGVDLGSGTDTLAFDGAAGTTGNVELVANDVAFAIGVERIEKRGDGTWVFEGQDIPQEFDFAPASILQGTAIIRSQFLSVDVTNAPGARLEGAGGVRNLINEGTFSPGEGGVGTFAITNDLTLEPGSTLEIDIAANGSADLIAVGDDVIIDGALAVNGVMYPAGFPRDQDYVIITAAEQVTGAFSSVTDNLPDVDVTVAYNDQDVTISYDRGLDESDKSIQANSVQAGLVDGRIFAETLRRRGVLMGAANGFVDAGGQQVAQTGNPTGLGSDGKRYAVWGAAMGALADVSGGNGRTGYDAGLGGLATGFDGFIPLDDGVIRVGLAAGFSTGNIDSDLSDADVDTIHIGAHGVYERGDFGISAAVSYGFQDYDIDRVIELIGAPSVTATGGADGSVFSLSIGAKYTVYEAETFKVSPIAHVEHISAKRDAYTETGAGILDLNVDAERFNRTFVAAGVRLEAETQSGAVTIRPQLDLMYEHAFGDDSAVVNSNAVNVQTASFTTRGGDQASNQVAVGTGFAIDISQRLSAHIRYDGNFGNGFTSHRGSAGIAWSF